MKPLRRRTDAMPSPSTIPFGQLACLIAFCAPGFAQEPQPYTITGTLWVVENGTKRLPVNGEIYLCYFSASEMGTSQRRESLTDGTFRCEFPEDAQELAVGRLEIEGRNALCTWTGSLADAAKPLDLQASFLPESRLRVRIRESGVELEEAQLEHECWGPVTSEKTGKVELTLTQGYCSHTTRLPLLVDPFPSYCEPFGVWSQTKSLAAGKPGYAWGRTTIDLRRGGDFWIDLVPEARIRLKVIYPPNPLPQRLYLNCQGYELIRELGQPQYEFDGLPPGSMELSTSNSGPGSHKIWLRSTAQLVSGESCELTIDLRPDVLKERVAVGGILAVDPSWGHDFGEPRLELQRIDSWDNRLVRELSLEAAPADGGSFTWNAGELTIGRHFVTVEPFGWSSVFSVTKETSQLTWAVPPRIRCTVRLVDVETRAVLRAPSIQWRPANPEFPDALPLRESTWDEGASGYTIDAPRGPTLILGRFEGYCPQGMRALLSNSPRTLEVGLRPACSIRVRLVRSGRAMEFPTGVVAHAEHVNTHALEVDSVSSPELITLSVDRPGQYAVSLTGVIGFQTPNPILVEARLREFVDVVFGQ